MKSQRANFLSPASQATSPDSPGPNGALAGDKGCTCDRAWVAAGSIWWIPEASHSASRFVDVFDLKGKNGKSSRHRKKMKKVVKKECWRLEDLEVRGTATRQPCFEASPKPIAMNTLKWSQADSTVHLTKPQGFGSLAGQLQQRTFLCDDKLWQQLAAPSLLGNLESSVALLEMKFCERPYREAIGSISMSHWKDPQRLLF